MADGPNGVPFSEVLDHSVLREEAELFERMRAPVLYFGLPAYGGYGQPGPLPPDPPMYWSIQRDAVLRSTVLHESIWGSAIRIATTKVSSLGWEIQGDYPTKVKRIQRMMLTLDNKSYVAAIGRGVRDYLTTDNGEWWEIVRASGVLGSRILGLMHLDSQRCHRTGDPSRPIYYRDILGQYHEMRDYQLINLTDLPNPGSEWLGVGMCSASSAYTHIYKLAAIERYINEKITGSRPQEIHLVSGINRKTLEQALQMADEQQSEKGAVFFKGAVVVPFLQGSEVKGYRVPLAELPDGFNRKEEFDLAITAYADAIGIDQQELQPLSGQGLGTGTQSRVLAEKAKGKGLASRNKQFIQEINEKVAPDGITMVFVERDLDDEIKKASATSARATSRATMIANQEITAVESRQLAVDDNDLPKEFLPPEGDQTPEQGLSDEEKPLEPEETEPIPAVAAEEPVVPPEGSPGFQTAMSELTAKQLLLEVGLARKELRDALRG